MVIDLLVALAAGQHHLVGVDDDDIVAIVHMGRKGRLVLAAQAQAMTRRAGRRPVLGVNQHPFLFDVGGFAE